MKPKKLLPLITLVLIFLSSFFYFLNPTTDADLGWHLRYGQHFAQSGQILHDNTFSTQMPDYQWPNHSWGYDILIYQLFTQFNFLGLSIFAAIIIALSLAIALQSHLKTSAFPLVVFFFFGNQLLNLGARSQLSSLLFTAMLWALFFKLPLISHPLELNTQLKSLKSAFTSRFIIISIFIIPLIFLAWSNLHGQYILGLAFYGIFAMTFRHNHSESTASAPLLTSSKKVKISTKTLNAKSANTTLSAKSIIAISFLISCLTSLINPFGTNLIQTALSHFNSQAFPYVMEWMPWEWGTPRLNFLIAFTLILAAAIYLLKQKRSSEFWSSFSQPFILIILIIMAGLAFKSRRLITYYLLISLPIVALIVDHYLPLKLINWWQQTSPFFRKLHLGSSKASKIFTKYQINLVLLIGITLFSGYQLYSRWPSIIHQDWTTYCNSSVLCSEPLLDYLEEHQIRGKIFNDYRLGGWLIYRYPQEKVYIDGRMTLWEEPTGISPFLRYLHIVHTQRGSYDVFRAENFDYVIVHHPFNLHQALANTLKWPALYSDDRLTLFQNPIATLSAQVAP